MPLKTPIFRHVFEVIPRILMKFCLIIIIIIIIIINAPNYNVEQIRREDISDNENDQTEPDVPGTDEIVEEWFEDEKELVERIKAIMNEANRSRLPNLKRVDRKKVNEEAKKVEVVLSKMSTSYITQTNDLIYATVTVVTENLGVKTATNEKEVGRRIPGGKGGWKVKYSN